MRPLERGDEMHLQCVDRPGDEPCPGAERKRAGRDGILDRAERSGGRARAAARGRRVLTLGQPVNLVVEQDDVQVHVAAQHVQHVIAADGQPIPIARHHPDVELRIRELDPRRDRGRASMHGVEAVRRHVIRKARGAADAADEHRLLALQLQLGARLLYRLEDRVVAAARTPADFLVRGVVLGRELGVADGGDGHTIFLIACAISVTRNGLPVTFPSGSAGEGHGQTVPRDRDRAGDQEDRMTVTTISDAQLAPKDYASDQEVRWCPGCGDYAILKAVQKACAELELKREQTVFVSGIGCAARFPYYMSTYGFHTVHGRAPAIATGIKLANPELDVWVMTGDGDGLSIGGNHMLHVLRRNVDLQIVLFNNEIYGLTKGQYSPTSRRGTRSPSTPQGSIENPVSPCAFALGAGGRFVARAVDTQQAEVVALLKRAHAHRGASFVEVFQNCVVFNDGVFDSFTAKDAAPGAQLHLEHGKPLVFGPNKERGLRLKPGTLALEAVPVGDGGVPLDQILVHDETNRALAHLLVGLEPPEFPMALGVLYCSPATSYEADVYAQARAAGFGRDVADLGALLTRDGTWTVE